MDEYIAKRLEDIGQIKEISTNCYVNHIPCDYSDYTVESLQRFVQDDVEGLKERINAIQNAVLDIMTICKGKIDLD